ncbi:MAG: MFS transporter [Rhodospirillaceae bacterium]|nr:MFS transporter [Rhodospirillaceae bacterium]
MNTSASPNPASARARLTPVTLLRVFLPFALGYFLSYIFRTVNAVISPDLVAELSLSASTLGLLTSAYFLSFAAFQLPLGMLLDRFGPRKVEAALLLFAGMGAVLFAVAEQTSTLIFARALIGLGVSACLMASFKAYVMWFPKEKLPLINGFQMTAGGLGALAATQPVEVLLGLTDWRGVFWGLAALTFAASAIIFFVVPDGAHKHANATLKEAAQGVMEVFTSRLFWRVAPITVMSQAVFLSLQSLWSGPWLRDVAGLARPEVAATLFWIAAAMIAGFLSWGVIAERLHKLFAIKPMNVAILGMSGFIAMQLVLALQIEGLGIAAFVAFGFFGTAGILPYAALSQAFPPHLAGRVNTGVNLLVFVMAFAMQWLVGAIIDLWPGTAGGGYATEGYAWAFTILLGLQAAGLAWYALGAKKA